MQTMDLDALTTPELYGELCNIIERNYHGWPSPGTADDDGLLHTSNEARAATNAVLAAVRRVAGAEPSPLADPRNWVIAGNPGHSDEWYDAYCARIVHHATDAAGPAPELPDE